MTRARANFSQYIRALKKDGFTIDKDGQFDKERITILKKELPDRILELQLWGDGKHRISHWMNGSMNTLPTDFSSLAGMQAAIRTESTRSDNSRHGARK
jgi:hypothetical protein